MEFIPDVVLAKPHSPAIQQRYNISRKAFYEKRVARNVAASESAGRPSKVSKLFENRKMTRRSLEQCHEAGAISERTSRRYAERLSRDTSDVNLEKVNVEKENFGEDDVQKANVQKGPLGEYEFR